MMKSALDWLMGKSDPLSLPNDLSSIDKSEQADAHLDTPKENAFCNGHFTEENYSKKSFTRVNNEETKSPWGRTLTPKNPKFIMHNSPKSPTSRINSPSKRSPVSWDEISFSSDVISPGFASRIAKETRGGKKVFDGSRKYPIGQEKYIRAGIVPNVRLKGRSKPVVMARRTPTSPLLPLASTSPFSSSSLASGFLAAATTRMPDISSVVSVLDSTPASSATDSIKDPTSVHAVVAALEQAQLIKSGIKRSIYVDHEDSSKRQKCSSHSIIENINDFPNSGTNQSFNNGNSVGGEKRALDHSPNNNNNGDNEGPPSSNDRPQLSPENKRRCITDPRIASLSSSKNIKSFVNPSFNHQSNGGRDSPFSIYESHRDSDSESNKSLESRHSRLSDRSFREQNHDPSGERTSSSNQDLYDRSGSQTPQSLRGGYGIGGVSNGSSHSSRTTTPSRPSHIFTLEAYKVDKAKSHHRLNRMLGMLFNNETEENHDPPNESQNLNSVPSLNADVLQGTTIIPVSSGTTTDSSAPTSASSAPTSASTPSTLSLSSSLLKEVPAKIEPSVLKPVETKVAVAASDSEGDKHEATESPSSSVNLESNSASEAVVLTETLQEGEKTQKALDKNGSVPIPVSSVSQKVVVSASRIEPPPVSSSSLETICKIPTVLPSSSVASSASIGTLSQVEKQSFAITSVINTIIPSPSLAPAQNSLNVSSNALKSLKNTDSNKKEPLFNSGSNPLLPTSTTNNNKGEPPSLAKFVSFIDSVKTGISDSVGTSKGSDSSLSKDKSVSSPITESGLIPQCSTLPRSISESSIKPSQTISSFSLATSTSTALAPISSSLFKTDGKANVVSQGGYVFSSPFSFNSSSLTTTSAGSTTTTASNLFTFGASSVQSSSSTPTSNSFVSGFISETGSHALGTSGFSFSKPESSTKTVSSTTPPVTAAALFDNTSNKTPVYNFGTSSLPTQTTTTTKSSSAFTFGSSTLPTKPQEKSASSPFQFDPPPSSGSTLPLKTPTFSTTVGGGFSFNTNPASGTAAPTASFPPPSYPQFGATSNKESGTSNVFTFGSNTSSEQSSGLTFSSAAKNNTSTGNNVFTFGQTNSAQPMFGVNLPVTSAGAGFGNTVSNGTGSSPFSFGSGTSDKSSIPFGGSQVVPAFGSSTLGNKPTHQAMFGGNTAASPPKFGVPSNVGSTMPLFGGSNESNPNPFAAVKSPVVSPTPTFGGFNSPNSGSSNMPSLPSAPAQNPFQMTQSNNNPNSTGFTFGQAAQQSPNNVFTFGSQQANPSAPSNASFGTSPFNFANNNAAPGATNLFTLGVTSEPSTAPRRPKVKAHHRRR